ncbi:MAG: anaerobic ribonucleoside triphosphate reductase [Bacilli bacterium]|nr:anaerobic ribonucleoside triphosphate reductase [Bacilli bacterium]
MAEKKLDKSTLKVIKRDGKKVPFTEEKIAVAIRKGFEGLVIENEYTPEDHNKVFNEVLDEISANYSDGELIKIEDIQDMIESKLKTLGYLDVLESFSSYRERRAESRKIFVSRQHKLMKAIESLTLKDAKDEDTKRDNANVDGNTAMGTMLQYGSTLSKEFAKSYMMKAKFAEAHDSGQIHIHDMDFLPMGTTTCCQIDLLELFKDGFSTGHGHLRCPNDIMSYSALAAIAIQSNQNDQHGGQSLPAFDYFMAPGVLKTFKKQFKQMLSDYLELMGFINLVAFKSIIKTIDSIKTIKFDIADFEKFYEDSEEVEKIFKTAYKKAYQKTDRITFQAMEAFIHNLNTMHSRAGAQVPFSSINFGTDTTPEGRMVTKNYLLATECGLGMGETPIFPISIFKVKEGINYFEEDINYDLFKLACRVSSKRLFPNFSFIDSPFNLQYYVEGDYKTEIAYMGCRTRVMGNVANPDKEIVSGRGNLSFTTINLPRIGIKHGTVTNKKIDMDGFYQELGDLMDLVRDQLLERFESQCSKKVYNFPFLLGQGVWIDSKGLKPNQKIRNVLKNGTLTIGFIGLAECLKALIGEHHGESAKAQKLGLEIINFMRDRADQYADEYKLNFSIIATPAEGLSGRFTGIDKSIYGILPGITDREYYTNSFHVPVYYNIGIVDKLRIEGPYHNLTNGGHISYIELDGDVCNNLEAFEKIVKIMHDNKIGYGAINHPVDRDPVCGYTGVIGDVCPNCGRREGEGVPIERLKSLDLSSSCAK